VYYLYAVAGVALIASLIADRRKTLQALKISLRRFINIAPRFLIMLIFVSIILFIVSEELIIRYLGTDNKTAAVFLASFLGSITITPGFIAFPLAGILLSKGVAYMVLSAFTTTLMMVGVLTYPVEKAYLGAQVTVLRNAISYLTALVVALITGIVFGELF
jgi:uncharacterized membrane protein YraQ (UPF0718 family)